MRQGPKSAYVLLLRTPTLLTASTTKPVDQPPATGVACVALVRGSAPKQQGQPAKQQRQQQRNLNTEPQQQHRYRPITKPPVPSAPRKAAAQQVPVARKHQQTRKQQTEDDGEHPMVTLLLRQVEVLTVDKCKLQSECEALRRENTQLQELLGYLSSKDSASSLRTPNLSSDCIEIPVSVAC